MPLVFMKKFHFKIKTKEKRIEDVMLFIMFFNGINQKDVSYGMQEKDPLVLPKSKHQDFLI